MDVLVIPDQHSDPRFENKRADYLGKYILDVRPTVVVNLGDCADMASLCSYDRGKRSFFGRNYRTDINHHLDFQDRLWHPIRRAKKKMPRAIVLEGNHENRVEKALYLSPELINTMGFEDFQFKEYYDDIVRYEGSAPGTIEINGVTFSHYLVSGVMGRPIGGVHSASSLVASCLTSVVVGHSHITDYHIRTDSRGRRVSGLVAGCYFEYDNEWAGKQVNRLYWRCVIMLHNVENGTYDPEWISIDRLKAEYGDG